VLVSSVHSPDRSVYAEKRIIYPLMGSVGIEVSSAWTDVYSVDPQSESN